MCRWPKCKEAVVSLKSVACSKHEHEFYEKMSLKPISGKGADNRSPPPPPPPPAPSKRHKKDDNADAQNVRERLLAVKQEVIELASAVGNRHHWMPTKEASGRQSGIRTSTSTCGCRRKHLRTCRDMAMSGGTHMWPSTA